MITSSDLIAKFRQALDEKWGYIWGTAGVMWTQARQDALDKTTDENRAQGRKYGKKWIGHMVADCSGLFTWAFRQFGETMYHGSNTMYKSYCTDKGQLKGGARSDGKELRPGTAVFVDKSGNKSHVGLYVGNGTVIEAASTIKGVTTSNVTDRKWTYWGELKGVEFGGEPGPSPDVKPTLHRGDSGQYVTLMQTMLINKGYSCGSSGADGKFGNDTLAAVKQFQRDAGLQMDGVVGPATWAALEKAGPVVETWTVTIPHLPKYKADALVSQYDGATMTKEESD